MKILLARLTTYMKTERFKLIIGIMFLFSLYYIVYVNSEISYIGSILSVYTDSITIIFMAGIFLLNTINTINLFDKNTPYIIRHKTKNKYFNRLTKEIIINNTILFILNLLMLIIFLIIFNREGLVIDKIGSYSVNNLTYTLVYLFKFFILIQFFSVICMCFYKIKLKFIVWILMGVLIVLAFSTPYGELPAIDSFNNMFINPIEYFRIHEYSSFVFELKVTGIYLFIWFLLTVIIYTISKKFIKEIRI